MTHPSQPRVLVIDNDERITQYLQTIFTKRGYAVYAAQGFGAELRAHALHLAQQVRPHVAIIDLRLDDDYTDDPTGLLLLPALASARCILYSAYLAPSVLSRVKRQYNVFDWVDKQNVSALYAVVDEAANQASASRRGLTIQWPPSWQREQIIAALFKDAHTLPEIAILDDLIAQLFSTNHRIIPEALTGAVDGLRSVVRGRSVVTKVYPDNRQPLVLKLGKAERIRREYENYQTYVHNQLPGLFHTQIEKHVAFWDLGGTLYSFMGADQQVLPTFAQHYARTDKLDAILTPLHHLFQSVWQPHYEAMQPLAATSLFAAYDEVFHLEEKLARIEADLIQQLRAATTRSLIDPVQWVRAFGHDSVMPAARQAVTHGDLQGDNLFVEGERAWIIDFERTGPSHALRDFAELEVDIFARLLPHDRVDWLALYSLARTLVGPADVGVSLSLSDALAGNREIAKASQVITGLRALAREVVHYNDQREHLWAMLFDALFVASVNSMPASQRLRALLYAAVICERLAQWGAVWS